MAIFILHTHAQHIHNSVWIARSIAATSQLDRHHWWRYVDNERLVNIINKRVEDGKMDERTKLMSNQNDNHMHIKWTLFVFSSFYHHIMWFLRSKFHICSLSAFIRLTASCIAYTIFHWTREKINATNKLKKCSVFFTRGMTSTLELWMYTRSVRPKMPKRSQVHETMHHETQCISAHHISSIRFCTACFCYLLLPVWFFSFSVRIVYYNWKKQHSKYYAIIFDWQLFGVYQTNVFEYQRLTMTHTH